MARKGFCSLVAVNIDFPDGPNKPPKFTNYRIFQNMDFVVNVNELVTKDVPGEPNSCLVLDNGTKIFILDKVEDFEVS